MRKRFVRCIRMVAAGLIVAACDSESVTAPGSVKGNYYLERVDNVSLPVVFSASASERYQLLWENLYFDGNGVVTRTQRVDYENTVTGEKRSSESSVTAEYRVKGDSIEIGSFTPCPINALCVANDLGVVADGVLVVRSARYGGRELSYRAGIAID